MPGVGGSNQAKSGSRKVLMQIAAWGDMPGLRERGGRAGVTLSTPSWRRGAITHCQGVSRGQKHRPAGCASP